MLKAGHYHPLFGVCHSSRELTFPVTTPPYAWRMKFGIRVPSLTKRIAARTSWKRVVRHSLGLKAPRGYGWLTNPRKAAYNRVYNRTTVGLGKGCLVMAAFWGSAAVGVVVLLIALR